MGPQYTSCVAPKDFSKVPELAVAILVGAGLVSFLAAVANPLLLWVGSAIILQALRIVLDWMLNGKLICLHRNHPNCDCGDSGSTVCAIGVVGDIEEVGEDKNPIEDVDNDYAINMMLAPATHAEFAKNHENAFDFINNYTNDTISAAAKQNLTLAHGGPQGDLLSAQPDMPGFVGYFRTFVFHTVTKEFFAWNELFGHNFGSAGPSGVKDAWADHLVKHAWKQPVIYSLPMLHCEFEGTRIKDTLDAIEAFSFGGSWCKKNFLFRFFCIVLQSILAPIALLAVIAAWASADDGTQADALADPAAGEVRPKDAIIVKGRWAYDGGHDGYNEIHAVRILQKVAWVPTTKAEFEAFQKRWCEKLGEVPHSDTPGQPPKNPTSRQQAVYVAQQRPENMWRWHPEIDGCRPTSD
jgi:hypothetical protein